MEWNKNPDGHAVDTTFMWEEEYLNGAHVEGAKVLFSIVMKRARYRIGFFKTRPVDAHVFVVTEEHLMDIEYTETGRKVGYGAWRVPYSAIKDVTLLSAKRDILFWFEKVGLIKRKFGEEAPRIHEAVKARWEQVKAEAKAREVIPVHPPTERG